MRKMSDGVRFNNEKKSHGLIEDHEKKGDGVRVHVKKELWGERSP